MNKAAVIEEIISKLRSQLAVAAGASNEAASYASDEEAKAESKWDTQGIEASYLAAGQAGQARVIAEAIQSLKSFLLDIQSDNKTITAGTLIECDLNGFNDWFFLSPEGGGVSVKIDDSEVTVITPQSPIGQQIIGKKAGANFNLPNGSKGTVLSVS